jgi:Tfp pilus assembly pilus retraction ATPase PilT
MDDTESLDSLVNELNSSANRQHTPTTALVEWLEQLRADAGSDLYLVAGLPPSIRVDGVIRALPSASLDSDDIEQQVLALLPSKAAERYRAGSAADASFRQGSLGRFRVNLHRERGRAAATIRAVPLHPPELSGLALPAAVEGLTRLK